MTIDSFFQAVGSFVTQSLDIIVKLISFVGNVLSLILNLVTLLPTNLSVITLAGVSLLGFIIFYKIIRKG